jgi:hypothetical protein
MITITQFSGMLLRAAKHCLASLGHADRRDAEPPATSGNAGRELSGAAPDAARAAQPEAEAVPAEPETATSGQAAQPQTPTGGQTAQAETAVAGPATETEAGATASETGAAADTTAAEPSAPADSTSAAAAGERAASQAPAIALLSRELHLDEKRAARLLDALSVVGQRLERVRQVTVVQPEGAPPSAVKVGELAYIVDLNQLPGGSGRRDHRGRREGGRPGGGRPGASRPGGGRGRSEGGSRPAPEDEVSGRFSMEAAAADRRREEAAERNRGRPGGRFGGPRGRGGGRYSGPGGGRGRPQERAGGAGPGGGRESANAERGARWQGHGGGGSPGAVAGAAVAGARRPEGAAGADSRGPGGPARGSAGGARGPQGGARGPGGGSPGAGQGGRRGPRGAGRGHRGLGGPHGRPARPQVSGTQTAAFTPTAPEGDTPREVRGAPPASAPPPEAEDLRSGAESPPPGGERARRNDEAPAHPGATATGPAGPSSDAGRAAPPK